ncbi:Uncharacterised protein [Raoultella ornithinolytica]|nr:Uncharacterised protein [Raoultella ornithinolytica]
MQIDWRVKGGRPILHGGVVMRMGNRDGINTAKRSYQRHRGGIEIGNAIPQNIALRRSEQKRALVNSEPGNGFKAKQGVVMLLPGVGMMADEILEGYPRLSADRDILAFIVTNLAA